MAYVGVDCPFSWSSWCPLGQFLHEGPVGAAAFQGSPKMMCSGALASKIRSQLLNGTSSSNFDLSITTTSSRRFWFCGLHLKNWPKQKSLGLEIRHLWMEGDPLRSAVYSSCQQAFIKDAKAVQWTIFQPGSSLEHNQQWSNISVWTYLFEPVVAAISFFAWIVGLAGIAEGYCELIANQLSCTMWSWVLILNLLAQCPIEGWETLETAILAS